MKRNLIKKINALSLILLLVQQLGHAHKFHMGMTKITLSENKQTLEISHRYFSNDIEQKIQQIQGNSHLLEESEQAVKSYLGEKFSIESNNKPFYIHWVGMEVNLDVIWIYQEIKIEHSLEVEKDIENWIICSEVLTESYSDQMNLVTVKMPHITLSQSFNQEKCQKLVSSYGYLNKP